MTITFSKQSKTQSRYYTIHDRQGNLFSSYTFTCVWGTVLESGRAKVYTFDSRGEMEKKMRFLMKKRISSGYKILYSYSHDSVYTEIFNSFGDQHAV